jgi:hypothetical protein
LHDNEYHHTHFTGFMLDEEIVASLWGSTSSATRNIFDPNIFVSCRHDLLGRGGGKKIRSTLIHLRVGIYVPKLNCGCNHSTYWIYTYQVSKFYLKNSRRDQPKNQFWLPNLQNAGDLGMGEIHSPLIRWRFRIWK